MRDSEGFVDAPSECVVREIERPEADRKGIEIDPGLKDRPAKALGFRPLELNGLGVVGLIGGDLPLWPMALMGGSAIALAVAALSPERWRPLFAIGLLAALAVLDVVCLFSFIVPILAHG